MKKQTIIKIIISILIFIAIICLEFFGLKFLQDTEILICNSNQSIDIKEEMENITSALPEVGTYSVKVVTRNNDEISMYYMYNGQLAYYNGPVGSSHADSNLSEFLNTQAIDGELIFNIILISTAILLIIFITYAFVSKNPIKGFIKFGYFILTILVFTFLLCVIPMISKNHGGLIYYNSIVIGSFLIGLLYGWKNKIFFLPTIIMIPFYFIATWLNYRNGMLWPDDFGGYVLLNFFGALIGRIIEKNKGMKRKEKNTPKNNSNEEEHIETNYGIKKSQIIELCVVIILVILALGINAYYLKPNNYIETNLQKYSQRPMEQYAYRIVQSKVYVTADSGNEWIEVPATFSNIYDVDRDFTSNSYYIGENKIIFERNNGDHISLIYSDDGGASWQDGMITDTSGYIIYMHFFDKNNGIAMVCYGNELGQREHIRASVTHDGGKTWTTRKADSSSVRINRGAEIEFTSMQDGTIENISYDGSKTVYKTEDGGISWKYDE